VYVGRITFDIKKTWLINDFIFWLFSKRLLFLLRRLTAHLPESEHPGTEINHFQEQQSLRKLPIF
jgi:hypothetical protein